MYRVSACFVLIGCSGRESSERSRSDSRSEQRTDDYSRHGRERMVFQLNGAPARPVVTVQADKTIIYYYSYETCPKIWFVVFLLIAGTGARIVVPCTRLPDFRCCRSADWFLLFACAYTLYAERANYSLVHNLEIWLKKNLYIIISICAVLYIT